MSLRCLAIAVALAGSFTASGQPGFLVHFDSLQAGHNGVAVSVREVEFGYLVFGMRYKPANGYRIRLSLIGLDFVGGVFFENTYWDNVNSHFHLGWTDAVGDDGDTCFAAFITRGFGIDAEKWLYRFNPAGDTISTRFLYTYPVEDSVHTHVQQIRRTNDGGYAAVGFWEVLSDLGSAVLVRMNQDGDTLFLRKYGYTGTSTSGTGVAEMPDGGFALTGHWAMSTNQPNKSFLIRTDAQGNQMWRANYGEYGLQTGAVRVDADGYIYTWSTYREYDWPPWEWQQMMLCKWYPGGGQVWCKRSHYNNYVITYDLEILPDGSFITSGSSLGNGVLAKFSPAGDSLWSRTYSPTVGGGYLYDVQPTSDGGFIACGSADRYDPIDTTFQTNQVIWVVKTDSLGCVVPGCHAVGVQEYALDLNEYLRLAPNPVPRGQALRVVFEPPADLAPQGPLHVLVLDALGKQVHQERMSACLPGQGTTLDLATNMLNSGLYYLHVVDATRWMAGAKLIVE